MTDLKLFVQAIENTEAARAKLAVINSDPASGTHSRWVEILEHLRAANAAAQSLERRAAGMPTPKVG